MTNCVISGTGLFTPTETISNQELVETFNQYIDLKFPDASEEEKAKLYSSEAFIEKASGIKSRHVMNKSGVLDAQRMCPDIAERDNEALSVQAEMAVLAAKEAMTHANKTAADIAAPCTHMTLLESSSGRESRDHKVDTMTNSCT